MNEYNELLFSQKRNENFQFCTKMYMGSTRNGIEFCFNSQTVLILLLLLKTVCGIELLSFNKTLRERDIFRLVWSPCVEICLM